MRTAIASLFLAATLTAPAWAQQPENHSAHAAAATAAADMTDGEVRKVDPDAGKITLKHGDIKSLGMPGMTMVFGVTDKAMLAKVKPGDKVKFTAANDTGRLVVTELQLVAQ